MKFTKTKVTMVFAAIGLFVLIMLSSEIVETNDAGFFQIKQAALSGDMSVISQPGTYGQWFGEIITYKNVATIRIGGVETEGSANLDSVKVIFNEGSKADIAALVRIELPSTDEERLNLKREFSGGFGHFIRSGIVPIVENAIKLAANLRSAQDAYTTLALFQQAVEDQLRNGMYVTKSVKVIVTKNTGDTEQQFKTQIVVGRDGLPLRMQNRLSELGCKVKECVISMPKFDEKVEESIAKRKDEAMLTELAKQKALRSKQDAITAKETGKANIAKMEAERLVEKIKAVTDAQKDFEVAEFNRKRDAEIAKAKLITMKANADGNRLLVNAGLTPIDRANIDKETAIGVAEHLSKWVGPQIVIGGGGTGKGGSGIENALMIQMMQDIVKRGAKTK